MLLTGIYIVKLRKKYLFSTSKFNIFGKKNYSKYIYSTYIYNSFFFFSVLQGITGGTFLYVTFFEVLPHELNQRGNRIMKLIFVLVGFLFICGFMFISH